MKKNKSNEILTDENFMKALDSKRDNIISYNTSRKEILSAIKKLKEELQKENEELESVKGKIKILNRSLKRKKISLSRTKKSLRLERKSVNELNKKFTSIDDSNLDFGENQKTKIK